MTKRIAIYLNDPICSRCSVVGLVKALRSNYYIKVIKDLENLSSFDMVIFPGGVGSSDYFDDFFDEKDIDSLKQFITNGGKYIGICMGAYWADQYYFNLLNDIRVKQYIKNPFSLIKRSYGTTVPAQWQGKYIEPFFYDGCVFEGDLDKVKVISSYANNYNKILPAAIIQNNVGLIGFHLESEEFWYTDEWNWSYMPSKWHRGYHHSLLIKFIEEMFKEDATSKEEQTTQGQTQSRIQEAYSYV